MESYSNSYKEAGVDVTKGYEAVKLMKKHVERTRVPGVADEIGGFGGMFIPNLTGISEPVLVSGTDGVGTKLKIAFMMDIHNTVGIDCVAMCANDVACSGAKPLFFLDYISVAKNIPEKVAAIVSGVADGCVQAGCALVGGETAEMPGIYTNDEYDLAGFCVGLADRKDIIDGKNIAAGDVLIGVESSGVHSNGFSLVRKAFNVSPERLSIYVDELGKTLGEELITPTKIYVKTIPAIKDVCKIHGISHITGGGFYENIPRMFSGNDLRAKVERKAVPVKPIFSLLASEGIPERDMFNTFNMGV
ncbi:MAG: phosphoribosylformylglycinamidine cyclo-ligase, partial [Acutalibacteraceae bacterium]|nr:phosphoribosylformylglycinamidine cyclo-ligase [Acutalibacteraceae bacterium]